MATRRLLLALVVLFMALPVWAANEERYPTSGGGTIIDANCTDAFNAGGAAVVDGTTTRTTQTTGAADNLCDIDNRILTTVNAGITTDQVLGPFYAPPGARGVIVIADGDTVTGAATWNVCLFADQPHDAGTTRTILCGTQQAGAIDLNYCFGSQGIAFNSTTCSGQSNPVVLPRPFYIKLDIVGVTTWAGSMSFEYVY